MHWTKQRGCVKFHFHSNWMSKFCCCYLLFYKAETEVYKLTTPSYASRILNCFVHKELIKQCTRVSSFWNLGVQVWTSRNFLFHVLVRNFDQQIARSLVSQSTAGFEHICLWECQSLDVSTNAIPVFINFLHLWSLCFNHDAVPPKKGTENISRASLTGYSWLLDDPHHCGRLSSRENYFRGRLYYFQKQTQIEVINSMRHENLSLY